MSHLLSKRRLSKAHAKSRQLDRLYCLYEDPTHTRKLLLHRRELDELIGAVERKGYTLVALYWKHGRAKLEIALARGKHKHDKRASEKSHDWERQKQRMLRSR